MANIKKGDTWPPLRGKAEDENGLMPLADADSIQFYGRFGNNVIGTAGTALVIDPPDSDGYNWQYIWAAGDTTMPGTYDCELQINWDLGSSPPKVESVPNDGSSNPELVIWEDVD